MEAAEPSFRTDRDPGSRDNYMSEIFTNLYHVQVIETFNLMK